MSDASSWSSSEYMMTAFSGVRSSWLMLARKALLAWLASSAACLAAFKSSSAFRRAVTSVNDTTAPVSAPSLTIG